MTCSLTLTISLDPSLWRIRPLGISIVSLSLVTKPYRYATFSRKGRGLFLTVYHTGPTPLAREGLSVCFNRPSSIYYIEDFAAHTITPRLITQDLYMAIGPNPSPDGDHMRRLDICIWIIQVSEWSLSGLEIASQLTSLLWSYMCSIPIVWPSTRCQ